jgi:hypothetical protein
MERVLRHMRRLWPDARVLLPAPLMLWPVVCFAAGERRWEHAALAVVVPILAYTSAASKRLFLGLFPMGLLGLVYDAMRFVKDVGLTPERVHLCDLRALDMRLLAVHVGGATGSVHDWFQAHPSPALDALCAIPYGTFIFATLGFAIYLYRHDYGRMRAFAWAFLWLNVAGFVTYHLYPAAPPWYFHANGCTVDLSARASEGPNLARVDAMLGFGYFAGFYGRSNDVFGAVPSLHVGYPALVVLFGWPVLRHAGRALSLLFLVSMCFAAVYLDHHWIVDVLLGLVYTTLIFLGVRAARDRITRASRRPPPRLASKRGALRPAGSST